MAPHRGRDMEGQGAAVATVTVPLVTVEVPQLVMGDRGATQGAVQGGAIAAARAGAAAQGGAAAAALGRPGSRLETRWVERVLSWLLGLVARNSALGRGARISSLGR